MSLRGRILHVLWVNRPPWPTARERRLIVKMVLAGTAAWWLSRLLGAPRPLFAVLVPLVAMGEDPFGALNVSFARTLGVFAGVLVGLGLLQLDLASTLLVALLLAISLGLGLVLRVGDAPVNNQIAITAMFIIYLGVGTRTETVGVARIWETALGAAVAVGVSSLLWPPDPLAEARRRVDRLHEWLREDLAEIGGLLVAGGAEAAEARLELIRERSLQAVGDVLDLERGARSLRLNPLRRADVEPYAAEWFRLTGAARQYRHARTLARIVADASTQQPPVPASEREALARTLAALTPAATDGGGVPPALDAATLHDPRAVGFAIKLRQMADDLT